MGIYLNPGNPCFCVKTLAEIASSAVLTAEVSRNLQFFHLNRIRIIQHRSEQSGRCFSYAWQKCQCTDTLIIRQTNLSICPSDCVGFTQRCHRIASFNRLADEHISCVVLPNINVSVHQTFCFSSSAVSVSSLSSSEPPFSNHQHHILKPTAKTAAITNAIFVAIIISPFRSDSQI